VLDFMKPLRSIWWVHGAGRKTYSYRQHGPVLSGRIEPRQAGASIAGVRLSGKCAMAAKRGAKLALPGTDDPGADASESGDHDGLPSVARAAAGPAVPLVPEAGARALFAEAKNLSDDANRARNPD